MRILITTWVFPTHGGIITFLDRVVPWFTASGHEFDVVAIAPASDAYKPFPHLPPERIHGLAQIHLPRPFSFPLFHFILKVLRTVRRRECELIFCQDPFFSGIPSLVASKLLGIPLMVADHGMITNFTEREYWSNFGFRMVSPWQWISRLVMKAVLSGATLVYAPGPDVAQRIRTFFGEAASEKARTFPIGIDTDRFQPRKEVREAVRAELSLGRSLTAIFVGRLHVESGLEHLIEAVGLLRSDERPVVLVVGDGVLRPRYVSLAEARAPGVFRFLGYSDRVPEYLNAADIFVFPKVFAGGYSISLREAMAVGLPCIATAGVDSHDLIIESGTNGVLVPPKDSVSLSKEIERLLSDPDLRERLGSQARRTILERFSMETFRSQMERLLSEAAGPRTRPSG